VERWSDPTPLSLHLKIEVYSKMESKKRKIKLIYCPHSEMWMEPQNCYFCFRKQEAAAKQTPKKQSDKTVNTWLKKYLKEPHWLDNWDSQLDRPKRLIVRDRHGNAVAREATVKLRRTRKTWGITDYCKYCTDFLTERPEADAEDPCIKCGIRDTIREEQEQYTEIFLKIEENFHSRGD
jgi:hypothetical protein